MKNLIVLVILCICTGVFAQDKLRDRIISIEELNEDFNFYRDILENTHPGLHRYSEPLEMTARLDSVASLLNRDMEFYEFYRILASLNSSIRCAHSFVLPDKNFDSYMIDIVKGIPLYLYPVAGKMVVLFNGTNEEGIKPGFELVAINDQPISDVKKEMMDMYWEDGYNMNGKINVLEGPVFSVFYYAFIDQPEVFNLTFVDENNKQKSFRINANTFAETQKMFKKNPVNKKVLKVFKNAPVKGWNFEILKDVKNTGYLRFNGFAHKKAVSNESAAILMQEFMNDVIEQISKKEVDHLILDLRGNKGGWDAMGIELYKFLAKSDKQFELYDKSFSVTNDTSYLKYSDLNEADIASLDKELIPQPDGTFLLDPEYSKSGLGQVPYSDRFTGKLYILIDRGTASAATEFVAVAKSNKIGTVVGEESGGTYEGSNGVSFLTFELPNSKMYLRTPLVNSKLAVQAVDEAGRGVRPDIEVKFTKEDLMLRNDRQLKYIKRLIKNIN